MWCGVVWLYISPVAPFLSFFLSPWLRMVFFFCRVRVIVRNISLFGCRLFIVNGDELDIDTDIIPKGASSSTVYWRCEKYLIWRPTKRRGLIKPLSVFL